MVRSAIRSGGRIVLVCAAYVVAAWLSGVLTLPRDTLASFRPPNALIFALALFGPPAQWWFYPLASIPGNPSLFDPRVSWTAAFGFTAANVVEVALALAMVRLLLRRPPRFNSLKDCVIFTGGVAGVSSAAAAAIGATAVRLQNNPPLPFWPTWRTWLLGDALALIVLVPAIMLSARGSWRVRSTRRREAALVVVGLIAVTIPALTGSLGDIGRFPALAYAPLPFLFWAALRLGVVESSLAVLAVSGVVLGAALSRVGAFTGLSTADAALSMQLLLLMMAVPVMFLAATVDERRQGEHRFRSVFRSTPDVITISRLRDGRFIDVNESFERTTGITRENALGRTSIDLGIWPDKATRDAVVSQLVRDGRLSNFRLDLRGTDGTIRHGLISAEPIELDGEDALITVQRDITGQIQADEDKARIQEQLEQARKMEAIGQLAGGIAHDFNNLLQAIKGYTEIAAGRLPANHPAAAALEQVAKAADQAATLTNQLLTFSRREALKSKPLDLNAVVGDLVRILRRLIGEHIELRVREGEALPLMLADPSQVEQVVMNLCLNARDAMPSGGRILIRTGAAHFAADDCRDLPWAREGDWVWLRVADQGIGIPADVLPRIFEPFFTTKGADRGTGLGLATVYAIVERHGGLVSVDTAPGAGTTFTIYFPATAEMASVGALDHLARGEAPPINRAAHAVQARLDLRGETILLAEDEPFVRELAVEFLESAGYRVLVACDGAEADEIVSGPATFDLALLDVAMPVRTGRQVFDTIQRVRPSLPVIFTSGYSFGELSDISTVASAILPKPYSRAVLLSTIRAALSKPDNADSIGRILTTDSLPKPVQGG
jgi:PAS domain S-box-containing protein